MYIVFLESAALASSLQSEEGLTLSMTTARQHFHKDEHFSKTPFFFFLNVCRSSCSSEVPIDFLQLNAVQLMMNVPEIKLCSLFLSFVITVLYYCHVSGRNLGNICFLIDSYILLILYNLDQISYGPVT